MASSWLCWSGAGKGLLPPGEGGCGGLQLLLGGTNTKVSALGTLGRV